MSTTLKARPTIYKGIQMRSRLEASYAAWLDGCGFTWDYEPHVFADEKGQYLPDFRIKDFNLIGAGPIPNLYIEVKPTGWPGPGHTQDLDRILAGKDMIVADKTSAFLLALPGDNCLFTIPEKSGMTAYWVVDFTSDTDDFRPSLGVDLGGLGWKLPY